MMSSTKHKSPSADILVPVVPTTSEVGPRPNTTMSSSSSPHQRAGVKCKGTAAAKGAVGSSGDGKWGVGLHHHPPHPTKDKGDMVEIEVESGPTGMDVDVSNWEDDMEDASSYIEDKDDDAGSQLEGVGVEQADDDSDFTLVVNKKAQQRMAKKARKSRKVSPEAYQKQLHHQKKQLALDKVDEDSLASLVGVMTITVKGSEQYSQLNKRVDELGGSWFKQRRLAGGDLYEVNPSEKQNMIEKLRQDTYLAFDPVAVKEARQNSKRVCEACCVVFPRVHQDLVHDLLVFMFQQDEHHAIVGCRVIPLREAASYRLVWVETKDRGACDQALSIAKGMGVVCPETLVEALNKATYDRQGKTLGMWVKTHCPLTPKWLREKLRGEWFRVESPRDPLPCCCVIYAEEHTLITIMQLLESEGVLVDSCVEKDIPKLFGRRRKRPATAKPEQANLVRGTVATVEKRVVPVVPQTARDALMGTSRIEATVAEIDKRLAGVEAGLQQVTQNKANIEKAFEVMRASAAKLEALTSQVVGLQEQINKNLQAVDENIKGQLLAFKEDMLKGIETMLAKHKADVNAMLDMTSWGAGGSQRQPPPSPFRTSGKREVTSLSSSFGSHTKS